MRRRILAIMIAVLMAAPFVMTGCSRDDVAIVRIQLENMPQGTAGNSNSIVSRIFRWFVTEAWAASPLPNTVLKVILTAPDLTDVSFDIPADQREVSLEIPSGPARRITVHGYYDNGNVVVKNWGGHVELDLNPGDEIDVQINMLPVVTMWSVISEMDSMYVEWGMVAEQEGLYGILGYHIYRSVSGPVGPFNIVGTETGITASIHYDYSVEEGKTYCYAVSVFTNTLEGELSDPSLEELYFRPN